MARQVDPVDEVLQLFEAWNSALQTGDPDEVVKLYAEDGLLLPTLSNQVRRTPREIRDYFEAFLRLRPRGKLVEPHVRLFGDLAVNSGVDMFHLTRNGRTEQVAARFTFLYRRTPQGWRILEHHSSAMPEPVSLPRERTVAAATSDV
jgi:uncharacterized protein (TIGR02246 family)